MIRKKIQIKPDEVRNYPFHLLGDINIRAMEIYVNLYKFIQQLILHSLNTDRVASIFQAL